ncbi:MAG: sialidase family protein [Gemmatimonadota bacterium]|nr:sialidase family protein [Gemmatimonadota bacterium]
MAYPQGSMSLLRARFAPALAAAALAVSACRGRDAPSAVQILTSPAGPGAGESNLTVGGDGKVYLSWLEPAADSQVAFRFSVFEGDAWSAPRDIRVARDFFVNWADFPSLSVRADGRMAAHWLQRFGPTSYAYDVRVAQSADTGRTWGEAYAPHVDRSRTEKGFVTLWPEGDGFGAVWLDGRNADKAKPNPRQEMMLYSSPAVGVARATEVPLDARTCDCCQTTVALTANGPIVAYRDRTADEIRDIFVVRRVGGKWTDPVPVHDDGWRIDGCPVNGPMLAAAGNRVAIAWFTSAADTSRVNVAFSSDAGATFGPPTQMDEGNPAGRVAVALLPDGSALVSWVERAEGSAASVLVRRVREKEGAGPASTVTASTSARASGFPRMVVAGDHAYFSWTAPGAPSEVRVARASLAGLP